MDYALNLQAVINVITLQPFFEIPGRVGSEESIFNPGLVQSR